MQGKKFDKDKPRTDLLLEGCPDALMEISNVLGFGASKYGEHNWKGLENAKGRYRAAQLRHAIQGVTELRDEESKLLHAAHEACCVLFRLQLIIEEVKKLEETS